VGKPGEQGTSNEIGG
jgi:hypothetical protein